MVRTHQALIPIPMTETRMGEGDMTAKVDGEERGTRESEKGEMVGGGERAKNHERAMMSSRWSSSPALGRRHLPRGPTSHHPGLLG